MEKEIWLPMPGHEGKYIVSNYGRAKSLDYNHTGKSKEIKRWRTNSGYYRWALYIAGVRRFYLCHRMVAIAFIENTKGCPVVNHKDGNKANNSAKNLEWTTHSENCKHAFKTGLKTQAGEKNNLSKLSSEQVVFIKRNGAFYRNKVLSDRFSVNINQIKAIKAGRAWKHLNKHINVPDRWHMKILLNYLVARYG